MILSRGYDDPQEVLAFEASTPHPSAHLRPWLLILGVVKGNTGWLFFKRLGRLL